DTPDDGALETGREALETARGMLQKVERQHDLFQEALQTLAVDFSLPPVESPDLVPKKKLEQLQQQRAEADRLRADEARLASATEMAERQVAAAIEQVKDSRTVLQTALLEAEFASIEAAEAKRLDDTALAELEAVIEDFSRRRIEAQARLAAAREEAPAGEPLELAPLEAAAKETEAGRDGALRLDEAAKIRHARLLQGQADLGALAQELDELDRRYAIEGRIAALANGEGGAERITFQRFVLAALLDEALDAASQRLRLMSRNRYVLRRALAAADRRQVAGLDLEVDDAYTGRSRPVGTLSGGESFLASLALALGMADVIARHAGGIRLETMFIDEGFGSLDPEALDLAMRTLIDLRQEGRTIGIVSHVPELKERIDYRLEVKATARGSRATFVLP
ncbi:MAG: SbcC/MukB-like Walker B domain-containing protein, partial [Pseudomonadota bacterium]